MLNDLAANPVAPLVVGLHISKCAGTTLADHVSHRLPPKAWYLCSSFRNMQQNGALELIERTNLADLRFVFGHYVNEAVFSLVPDRPIFLFTGVRAPSERAVSEFFHMRKIRRIGGEEPISVASYFKIRNNTMCREILRAFPGIANSLKGSLAGQAAQLMRMFDFIYDTLDFREAVVPILRLLGLEPKSMTDSNVRKSDSGDAEAADAEFTLREQIPRYFGEDEELYEGLKPFLGKMRPFDENGAPNTFRDTRETELRQAPDAIGRLSSHLARFLVADYRNLGQLAELDALLARKQAWIDEVLTCRRTMSSKSPG